VGDFDPGCALVVVENKQATAGKLILMLANESESHGAGPVGILPLWPTYLDQHHY
jgi:hypothetical protein